MAAGEGPCQGGVAQSQAVVRFVQQRCSHPEIRGEDPWSLGRETQDQKGEAEGPERRKMVAESAETAGFGEDFAEEEQCVAEGGACGGVQRY